MDHYQYYPQIVYDLCMVLILYIIYRIYLAAAMCYGLGSHNPEDLTYCNNLRKDIEDMKKDSVKNVFL